MHDCVDCTIRVFCYPCVFEWFAVFQVRFVLCSRRCYWAVCLGVWLCLPGYHYGLGIPVFLVCQGIIIIGSHLCVLCIISGRVGWH